MNNFRVATGYVILFLILGTAISERLAQNLGRYMVVWFFSTQRISVEVTITSAIVLSRQQCHTPVGAKFTLFTKQDIVFPAVDLDEQVSERPMLASFRRTRRDIQESALEEDQSTVDGRKSVAGFSDR